MFEAVFASSRRVHAAKCDIRLSSRRTACALQKDTMHLVSNLVGLYFFGREVGGAFGGRALLGLYIAGGIAGSAAHCLWRYWQILGVTSGLSNLRFYGTTFQSGLLYSALRASFIPCADICCSQWPMAEVCKQDAVPPHLGLFWESLPCARVQGTAGYLSEPRVQGSHSFKTSQVHDSRL